MEKKRKQILDKASHKAEQFAKYAEDDTKEYGKLKPGLDIKQSDIERWVSLSKKGAKYYTNLSKSLKNRSVATVDKKEIKNIEKWVKKGYYTNAEYGDYYLNNEIHNYLEKEYRKSNPWDSMPY